MKIKSATTFLYLVIICILATVASCGGLQRTSSASDIFSNDRLPEERPEPLAGQVLTAAFIGLCSLSAYNFYNYWHPVLLVPFTALALFQGPIEAAGATAGLTLVLTIFSLFFSAFSLMYDQPFFILIFGGLFVMSIPWILFFGIICWCLYHEEKRKGRC